MDALAVRLEKHILQLLEKIEITMLIQIFLRTSLSGIAIAASLRDHVRRVKTRRELAALGLKEGIFYETNIPVSGKGEVADRERYNQQLQLQKKD